MIPLLDVSTAEWIAPRLGGEFGAAGRVVPRSYAGYVRVLHPAYDVNDELRTWAEVAEQTGRTVHPTVQWHSLVGLAEFEFNASGSWRGGAPEDGNLEPVVFAALVETLRAHTRTPESCTFALWDGYGWADDGSDGVTIEQLAGPRLRLPGREYLLFGGAVDSWDGIGVGPRSQSPNLVWPDDRAWFVASEIDFDSTVIGGSTELCAALLADSRIDALSIGPDDSLDVDADRINGAVNG